MTPFEKLLEDYRDAVRYAQSARLKLQSHRVYELEAAERAARERLTDYVRGLEKGVIGLARELKESK